MTKPLLININNQLIDIYQLPIEQRNSLFKLINDRARKTSKLTIGDKEKEAALNAEFAAEALKLLDPPSSQPALVVESTGPDGLKRNVKATTANKTQNEYLKPILNNSKPVINSAVQSFQDRYDALLTLDKENFHHAFGAMTAYTDNVERLSKIISSRLRTEATKKFITEHNELLNAKISLLTAQVLNVKTTVEKLQEDKDNKEKELISIEQKLAKIPTSNRIEQAHLVDKPSKFQRLIIEITKPFYSEPYLTAVKQKQQERCALLRRQQEIPTEISKAATAINNLDIDIANKRSEQAIIIKTILQFATSVAEAINNVYQRQQLEPAPESGHRRRHSYS